MFDKQLDWNKVNQLLKRKFLLRCITEGDYRKINKVYGLEVLLYLLEVNQEQGDIKRCKAIRQEIVWVSACSIYQSNFN